MRNRAVLFSFPTFSCLMGLLPPPNRAVHILDSLYRNPLLFPYLVTVDFGYCTVVRDRRQSMLESLLAAGFDLGRGRQVVAPNKLSALAVGKQEVQIDHFDRFCAGIFDDDLKHCPVVNASQ